MQRARAREGVKAVVGWLALLALVLAVVAASRVARAEGISLFLQPGYQGLWTETWDASGVKSTAHSDGVLQLYTIGLDRSFTQTLRLNAGGLFEDDFAWTREDGVSGETDRRLLNYHANLVLGTPLVTANLGYLHNTESNRSLGSPRRTLESDTASLLASYQPAELPSVTLRLTHTATYDPDRTSEDMITDDGQVLLSYAPGGAVRVNNQTRVSRSEDRIALLTSSLVSDSLQATYNDLLLDKRMVLAAGVNGSVQTTWVTAGSGGGLIYTQLFPAEGLYHLEVFGDLPTRDTLERNAALIDGNVEAKTSIDLGWGSTDATSYRDIGVAMRDAVQSANTFYLWMSEALPAEVVAAYTFEVYTSNDDVDPKTWTQVGTTGVSFAPFQNRFEIGFAAAPAKYYKVVTRPLAVGVTTNPAFEHLYVTELQVLSAVTGGQAAGKRTMAGVSVSASERTRLLDAHELYHDASLYLTRSIEPIAITTWVFDTGLSYSRKLLPVLGVSSRISRQEQDTGNGRASTTMGTAALTAKPLDTLNHSLAYSAQLHQDRRGSSFVQSLNAFNRADLYSGVAAQLTGGLSHGTTEGGGSQLGRQVAASLTLTPSSVVSVNGVYSYSDTEVSGGNQPRMRLGGDQMQASISLSPFPAAYLSGGVTYSRPFRAKHRLLRVFGGGFSPFPDGTLQLRLAYNESYDSVADNLSRLATAGLRLAVRPGIAADASYSFVDVRGPLGKTRSHVVGASLSVAL